MNNIMNMTKKTAIMTGVMMLSSAAIFGGAFYASEQKKVIQEQIRVDIADTQINNINRTFNNIDKEKNEAKKLDELKAFISESESYQKREDKEDSVVKAYNTSIKQLQTAFKEANNKVISDHTAKELKKEKGSDLKKKVAALKKIKSKIEAQKEVIYTKEEIKELDKKIDDLIKQYSDKMTDLEKKEKHSTSEPTEIPEGNNDNLPFDSQTDTIEETQTNDNDSIYTTDGGYNNTYTDGSDRFYTAPVTPNIKPIPVKPVAPTEPTDPVEPVEPTIPDTPVEPSEPTTPDTSPSSGATGGETIDK